MIKSEKRSFDDSALCRESLSQGVGGGGRGSGIYDEFFLYLPLRLETLEHSHYSHYVCDN